MGKEQYSALKFARMQPLQCNFLTHRRRRKVGAKDQILRQNLPLVACAYNIDDRVSGFDSNQDALAIILDTVPT